MKRSVLTGLLLLYGFSSFAQIDLKSDLKVCLPFSGNTNDFSGNNNHGVLSGNVTLTNDRFGFANRAYNFSGGQNDYIAINNFNLVSPNHQLTISMWAKVKKQTSTCLFILNPDNALDRCVGCAEYSGVGLVWDYGDIFNNGRVVASQNFDTLWHHYAYVMDGLNSLKKVYVDGTLMVTQQTSERLDNKQFPLYIGAGTSDIGRGSLRWNGKIDDVHIYARALNAIEIGALANNGSGESYLVCGVGTSAPEIEGNNVLYFYPTVSSDGHFFVAGDFTTLEKVTVTGLDGRVIRTFAGNVLHSADFLDLTGLSEGCYLVRKFGKAQDCSVQKLFVRY